MMAKQSSARGSACGQPHAAKPAGWRLSSAAEVEDAEFETVLPERQTPITPRALPGFSLFRKPDQPVIATETASSPGPAYWVLVAFCATTAFWMAGGYTIMTSRPSDIAATASPSLPLVSALKVTDITTNIAERAEGNVLNVGASIRNEGHETRLPPALIVSITYSDGQKRERLLEPVRTSIGPGSNIRFETMLPALRGTIEKVDIRMASPA
ncbi:hypothetical protein QBD01_000068 [Ochrobactrum sp. 19YEA23]|uniref:hypothetical protein n=1 Tax=Ochrobactrum sp. 19YEA23 TaxID=3039854 RepID=UPI00247A21D9|nr:hypothetical protein [Ochrobactrum sp. 19YEA23]